VAPTLAHEMIAYALRLEPDSETAHQMFRTISFLCRDWFANPRMLFVPAARSPELRRVVGYIRDNFADATVAGACTAAGLPQRTLHRRCRRELGFGIRTLIREVRIMRAMEMLAGKDRPIRDVACTVGFASIPSFTAAFSQRLGVSPSEFTRTSRTACTLSRLSGGAQP
jgi:AraC-like DNA-binding protein